MRGLQQSPLSTYVPIQRITENQPIRATCFHPSGQTYIVGSNSKALRICKYPDVETQQYLINESQSSIDCSSNSIAEESDNDRRPFLPIEPEISFTCLYIHCGSIYCSAFNRSGNLLATGSNDQIVHIMRYNQERHAPEGSEYKLPIHKGTVRDVCFLAQPPPPTDEWDYQSQEQSNDQSSNLVASAGAGDFEVNVTDCNVMKCVHSFKGHESTVMSLHGSNESTHTFVSGSLDGTIRIWDLRSKSAVSIITTKQAQLRVESTMANNKYPVVKQEPKSNDLDESLLNNTNGDHHNGIHTTIIKRDQLATDNIKQANPTEIQPGQIGGSPVGCVRLDPTGRLLVSGHLDGQCMLYDVNAGKAIQLFQAHQDEIRTLNFSPKSYYLLTGSYDRKVKLLDISGHLTSKLPSVVVAELGDKCVQTAWHPYDYNFVTTCADGSATLWTIPNFDKWIDSVRMD